MTYSKSLTVNTLRFKTQTKLLKTFINYATTIIVVHRLINHMKGYQGLTQVQAAGFIDNRFKTPRYEYGMQLVK